MLTTPTCTTRQAASKQQRWQAEPGGCNYRFSPKQKRLSLNPLGPSVPIGLAIKTERSEFKTGVPGFKTERFDFKTGQSGFKTGKPRAKTVRTDSKTGSSASRLGCPISRLGKYDFKTGRPGFKTGRPDLKTGRPDFKTDNDDFKTGVPGLNTGRPDLKTGRPDFKTEAPEFKTWEPDFKNGRPNFKRPDFDTGKPASQSSRPGGPISRLGSSCQCYYMQMRNMTIYKATETRCGEVERSCRVVPVLLHASAEYDDIQSNGNEVWGSRTIVQRGGVACATGTPGVVSYMRRFRCGGHV
jgi:hypothetical protein